MADRPTSYDPYGFMAAPWFGWFIVAVGVVAVVSLAIGDVAAGVLLAAMALVLTGFRNRARAKAAP